MVLLSCDVRLNINLKITLRGIWWPSNYCTYLLLINEKGTLHPLHSIECEYGWIYYLGRDLNGIALRPSWSLGQNRKVLCACRSFHPYRSNCMENSNAVWWHQNYFYLYGASEYPDVLFHIIKPYILTTKKVIIITSQIMSVPLIDLS